METYQEAKKWMTIRVIGIAAVVGLVLMCFFTTIAISISIDTIVR